jgi:hypothetical protein
MPRSTRTASTSAARPPFASPDLSAIRQQAFDIDHQVGDIEILIAAIFDKIDGMLDQTPAGMEAVNAINCFAICALRNAALIKVSGTNILNLTSEGGEAMNTLALSGAALALSAQVEQQGISGLVLRTPYGWMHVNRTEEHDHASMRAKQLAGLVALMSGADESDDMLHLVAKLSAEVAVAIQRTLFSGSGSIDDVALRARQIAQILISIQPDEGASDMPCLDMLWLAQQLADELVGTITSLSSDGGPL